MKSANVIGKRFLSVLQSMETGTNDVCRELTWKIIGSAIRVHRELGPGLLESTYRACLLEQLRVDGLRAQAEVPVPLTYRGASLAASYRADVIVENTVLLELKAVDRLTEIHDAQVLTYLKLCGFPVALLINFNERRLKDGIHRFANTLQSIRAVSDRA